MNNFANNFNKPGEDDLKNREERMISTIEFFKRIDLQNIIEDPNKKSQFIRNISFDQFKDFLLRVNGIQRNIPISDRVFNAGEDAKYIINLKDEKGMMRYCPPSNLDKIPLLEEAFNALKRMELNDKTQDAALMIGCAINAIHPFENGNGRTARNISMMIASSKEKFFAPQSNPEAIQSLIGSYLHNLHGLESLDIVGISGSEIKFPKMSNIDKLEFVNAIDNDLGDFIEACQIFTKKEKDSFKDLTISPKDKMFSFEGFLAKYKDHMAEIMKIYREFKNEYVRVLIDIFEKPSNFYIKDIPNIFNNLNSYQQKIFSDKTLLDIFYADMNKDVVEGKEFSWDYLLKFIKGDIE